ncbi:hypothetical protein M0R45_021877 [Rubus argutus]|uniref:Uncharacterized protein n=1 Tax=Rubus argutus TaxID=59490 RepID=A0AAW1XE93_RUBAR
MKKRQRRADHGGASAPMEAPKLEGATMSMPSKKPKIKAVAKVAPEEENYSCNVGSIWLDEQMSWGSIWSPFWDVEFMGEAHYELFSDHVVWDDDIWGLRTTINDIPMRVITDRS